MNIYLDKDKTIYNIQFTFDNKPFISEGDINNHPEILPYVSQVLNARTGKKSIRLCNIDKCRYYNERPESLGSLVIYSIQYGDIVLNMETGEQFYIPKTINQNNTELPLYINEWRSMTKELLTLVEPPIPLSEKLIGSKSLKDISNLVTTEDDLELYKSTWDCKVYKKDKYYIVISNRHHQAFGYKVNVDLEELTFDQKADLIDIHSSIHVKGLDSASIQDVIM